MNDTLYAGHQGLARYPSQQVLYQWNKNRDLSSLPHSAFVGQGDMRANGDCWMIMKAAEGLVGGKFFKYASGSHQQLDQPLAKAYKKGSYFLELQNDSVAAAIALDELAEGFVIVYSADSGVTFIPPQSSRVMGNTEAAVAVGSVYPDFTVELEYPLEVDIPVGVNCKISSMIWNGVRKMDEATDLVTVGWSPIDVTSGYYFWGKVGGDVAVKATTAVTLGDAVTVVGTTTAADQGSVTPISAHDQQQVAIIRDTLSDNEWGLATLTLGLQ